MSLQEGAWDVMEMIEFALRKKGASNSDKKAVDDRFGEVVRWCFRLEEDDYELVIREIDRTPSSAK